MGVSAALVRELDLAGDWGILTTNADLLVTNWNRWMEERFGGPAEAFRERPLFEVFPSLVVRKLDDLYRQALEGRTVLLSWRLHRYLLPLKPSTADTRFDFMQQTARILPLMDGAIVCGTATIIEDVTERVAYETELRERLEALREADRRKDEFLAMLAHELRNPLAPIANATQLLRLAGDDASMRCNARNLIERQIAHLVRLVDDLLDVSRVSRGKIALQMMPIDLAAVVRHAVETIRPLIDSRRHQLKVLLPSDSVRVDGDFVRLAQVVSNLLTNAAKYTDEGGKIEIVLETTKPAGGRPGEAVIRVRDNGRGIDPPALASLFDLFYQVAQNIDRAEGGLGIGLSLVRSLVEMHGGSVAANSDGHGRGSEFTVRLPLILDAPKPFPVATEPLPSVRRGRILVVDDNRDSAESMASILRIDGHEVSIAFDGRKAIEVAERDRPNVILLDIGLPRLNGYDACRVIRESGLDKVFVIAMSGYGQNEDRQRSQMACFNAYLVKPIEFDALRVLIAEALTSTPSAT
jgi:signal transduction histidine kinase/ActR/RegA family two-component response regulator